MSMRVGEGKVRGYVEQRIDAIKGSIDAARNISKSEGPVAAVVDVLVSGLGVLPINKFGEGAQARREAARKRIGMV